MWRRLLIGLAVALTGCSLGAPREPHGIMPPIAPTADEQPAPASGSASLPDVSSAAEDRSADLAVDQQLDQLWADGDWTGVIRLLENERVTDVPIFDQETIREKLYAAHINAGYASLRLNDKDGAMTHFLAAMALAPERSESEPGLIAVQRQYMEEAQQLLAALQRQQAAQQAAQASVEPPSD